MTFFQKTVVSLYRMLASIILVGVLAAALGYFATIIIYTINREWVAPIILTKSSARVMATGAEAFRARQAVSALEVSRDSLRLEISLQERQQAELRNLLGRFKQAQQVEQRASTDLAGRLGSLQGAHRSHNRQADQLNAASRAMQVTIEKDLKAGLITKETAMRSMAQIISMDGAATDSRLNTVKLDEQVRELQDGIRTIEGGAQSTRALESVSRLSALEKELAETEILLLKNRADLQNKTVEFEKLQAIVKTVEATPYFRIAQGETESAPFAFVPYENERAAEVGEEVYSCWAKVIFCSRVGTVTWVGSDEERGFHPVFQRDIRGFLVQLELDEPNAAKDQVLYLGSAPIWL